MHLIRDSTDTEVEFNWEAVRARARKNRRRRIAQRRFPSPPPPPPTPSISESENAIDIAAVVHELDMVIGEIAERQQLRGELAEQAQESDGNVSLHSLF